MLAVFMIGLAGCAVGAVVLEAAMAGVMGSFLWPAETPPSTLYNPDASESFVGLVGMFRSFILLATLVVWCSAPLLSGSLADTVCSLVALWWWAALGAAIWIRPGSTGGKIGAIAMVPVVVAVSLAVASAAGMFTFLVIGAVVSIFR